MYKYIEEIRNFVNNNHHSESSVLPYKNENGYNKKYYHLCAALDILGDTETAISDYLELENKNGRGLNYVYIYGILQILQLRNEAVKAIYNIFLKEIKENEVLNAIRLLRNKLSAHPFDKNSENGAFGIEACSLSTFLFSPYKFDLDYKKINHTVQYYHTLPFHKKVDILIKDNNINHISLNMKEIIEEQNSILEEYLYEICKHLQKIL
ncbi:hypothetical protein [Gallibacterium anatis]|uniref:Uncharacterized protein n=1 Tax=Gallibacterium anatis 4895 TaxID=1396510 RepID=A0A0A3APQ2_9PAST|nr:hypothetical protein [Gallibacterium anatis]KGQ63444.1 hypothetical protein IO48_01575 [Gallibacterium anatis 4895]